MRVDMKKCWSCGAVHRERHPCGCTVGTVDTAWPEVVENEPKREDDALSRIMRKVLGSPGTSEQREAMREVLHDEWREGHVEGFFRGLDREESREDSDSPWRKERG